MAFDKRRPSAQIALPTVIDDVKSPAEITARSASGPDNATKTLGATR
jgi:hypothetical protein